MSDFIEVPMPAQWPPMVTFKFEFSELEASTPDTRGEKTTLSRRPPPAGLPLLTAACFVLSEGVCGGAHSGGECSGTVVLAVSTAVKYVRHGGETIPSTVQFVDSLRYPPPGTHPAAPS